jgi:hypothetical protein
LQDRDEAPPGIGRRREPKKRAGKGTSRWRT